MRPTSRGYNSITNKLHAAWTKTMERTRALQSSAQRAMQTKANDHTHPLPGALACALETGAYTLCRSLILRGGGGDGGGGV